MFTITKAQDKLEKWFHVYVSWYTLFIMHFAENGIMKFASQVQYFSHSFYCFKQFFVYVSTRALSARKVGYCDDVIKKEGNVSS